MRHRKCALPDECTSQCQLSHTGLKEADAPPPGCHGGLRDDRQEPGPFITASTKRRIIVFLKLLELVFSFQSFFNQMLVINFVWTCPCTFI